MRVDGLMPLALLLLSKPTLRADPPPHLSSPHRAADQVDICLDDASCSRVHAALVHHQDGRIFLIDLHSVRREGSGCHACMRTCMRPGCLGNH